MKVKQLVDVKIECDPPSHAWGYGRNHAQQAEAAEKWCREFEDFVRDHRSQDAITLTVRRRFEDVCSHCGQVYEEDEDGPLCCNKAVDEWRAAKVAA